MNITTTSDHDGFTCLLLVSQPHHNHQTNSCRPNDIINPLSIMLVSTILNPGHNP